MSPSLEGEGAFKGLPLCGGAPQETCAGGPASGPAHPSRSLFLHLKNEKDNGKGNRLGATQPGSQLVFMI